MGIGSLSSIQQIEIRTVSNGKRFIPKFVKSVNRIRGSKRTTYNITTEDKLTSNSDV